MSKKHLSVVPENATATDAKPKIVRGDNEATITALRQIGERVTAGQWETPEAVALFEAMLLAEKRTSLALNDMEKALGMPGLAQAMLEWEGEVA